MSDLKYSEAFSELQQIVNDLGAEQVNVDELIEKVRRATDLIKICRSRLTITENTVAQILKELEDESELQ